MDHFGGCPELEVRKHERASAAGEPQISGQLPFVVPPMKDTTKPEGTQASGLRCLLSLF